MISRQLAVLLQSGINIISAFNIIKNQNNIKGVSKVLNKVTSSVESGNKLYDSLNSTKKFPSMFLSMIIIGEESGNLENIFLRLSNYYYKEYKLKQNLKQSLSYPIFILIVTMLGIIVISLTIIPMICKMIEDLNITNLPMSTKILIKFNYLFQNKIVMLSFLFIITVIIILIFLLKDKLFKIVVMNTPFISSIYKKVLSERFSSAFSMLLKSGISIIESLVMCEGIFNKEYKKIIKNIRFSIECGESLYESFKKSSVFPDFFCNMIKTGEESGRLDFVLENISEFYEKEIEFEVKTLTKLFEPTLIIILSLVVGLLLSSVMLPLFQIYGEI